MFGIVKQSGGSIGVYSELGRGTTFRVYLPRPAGQSPRARPQSNAAPSSGKETILVVEDEDALQSLVARILGGLGYSVLVAGTAAEALRIVRVLKRPSTCSYRRCLAGRRAGQRTGRRPAEDLARITRALHVWLRP